VYDYHNNNNKIILLYTLCIKMHWNIPFPEQKKEKIFWRGGLTPDPRPHPFNRPNQKLTPNLQVYHRSKKCWLDSRNQWSQCAVS